MAKASKNGPKFSGYCTPGVANHAKCKRVFLPWPGSNRPKVFTCRCECHDRRT